MVLECVFGNFKLHIEVPLLLIFFAFMMSDAVYTNLVIFRTCYIELGYNKSDCALLGGPNKTNITAHLEELVQPRASVINLTRNFTQSILSAIVCLFIGPWSDRFGRKPILVSTMAGMSMSYIMLMIFSMLPNISPWFLMLCSVPSIVTGGFSAMLTVIMSYITDVTTVQDRGVRMGIFEAVLALGILLGNLTSSYIFYATNYATVFLISGCCTITSVIFTCFCIPESLANRETQGYLKNFFKLRSLHELFKTTLKKRENYAREIIVCSFVMLTLFILVIDADTSVFFLYLREQLHWTLEQYTLYNCTASICYILGTVVGVYGLHKVLKIPEVVLIQIGFISMLNKSLLQGLATKSWHIYFAGAVHSFGGVLSPMIRSLVSKNVPNEEIGKVFAAIVISESLFGMLGPPFYTWVYNKTIIYKPGAFNFISAGFYIICILITLAIIMMQNIVSNIRYKELEGDINDDPRRSSTEEDEEELSQDTRVIG